MSDTTFTNEPARFGESLRLASPVRERVLRLGNRFVFASLLTLILLVAIPFGAVEQWWISIYECVVFGLAAFWIAELLLRNEWQIKDSSLIAPAIAILAFVFLQSVSLSWIGWSLFKGFGSLSADPFETRLMFFKLLALFLNGVLFWRYAATRRRMRLLIQAIIIVAVASAVFGIVRQAMQHQETGFLLPYLRRNSGFGQFVNKNHFALLMEMAIGLATGLMLGGAVRRERLLLYIAAVALMWTGLVLTSSRGGLLSSLGQIVFLVIMLWRGRVSARKGESRTKRSSFGSMIPALGLSVVLLIVVAVGAVWIGGDLLVTRLTSLPGEINTSVSEPHAGVRRREIWLATLQLIKSHPIAGTGLGAYSVAITKFHDASGKWTPEAAHNDYLELLAAGGLIGTLLVAWLAFSLLMRARPLVLSADKFQSAVCLGSLTGIFGVMAHNIVDFGLHVTANAVVFTALLVIATRKLTSLNNKPLEREFRP